jgi:hypothetical protein
VNAVLKWTINPWLVSASAHTQYQPVYQELQDTPASFLLSDAKDLSQCPEHMGEILATELYTKSSDEKMYTNHTTTQYCLNIKNISTERLQVIKIFNQRCSLRCTNVNAQIQEKSKKKATWLLTKISNSTVSDSKNSKVDKISNNWKKLL